MIPQVPTYGYAYRPKRKVNWVHHAKFILFMELVTVYALWCLK